MPGPPKTPSALNLFRGNPGKRAPNRREPKPTVATATPPPDLDAPAAAIWRERAAELVRLELLTVIDRGHLARACRLEALGLEQLALAELMPLRETKANGPQPSAELRAALLALEAADRIWFRFGITPSERTRLTTGEPGGDDDFESFRRKKPTRRSA